MWLDRDSRLITDVETGITRRSRLVWRLSKLDEAVAGYIGERGHELTDEELREPRVAPKTIPPVMAICPTSCSKWPGASSLVGMS